MGGHFVRKHVIRVSYVLRARLRRRDETAMRRLNVVCLRMPDGFFPPRPMSKVPGIRLLSDDGLRQCFSTFLDISSPPPRGAIDF